MSIPRAGVFTGCPSTKISQAPLLSSAEHCSYTRRRNCGRALRRAAAVASSGGLVKVPSSRSRMHSTWLAFDELAIFPATVPRVPCRDVVLKRGSRQNSAALRGAVRDPHHKQKPIGAFSLASVLVRHHQNSCDAAWGDLLKNSSIFSSLSITAGAATGCWREFKHCRIGSARFVELEQLKHCYDPCIDGISVMAPLVSAWDSDAALQAEATETLADAGSRRVTSSGARVACVQRYR